MPFSGREWDPGARCGHGVSSRAANFHEKLSALGNVQVQLGSKAEIWLFSRSTSLVLNGALGRLSFTWKQEIVTKGHQGPEHPQT